MAGGYVAGIVGWGVCREEGLNRVGWGCVDGRVGWGMCSGLDRVCRGVGWGVYRREGIEFAGGCVEGRVGWGVCRREGWNRVG